MRVALIAVLVAGALLAVVLSLNTSGLAQWAVEQQRGFQNQMAAAVRALRSGNAGAYAALLVAAGAYGFVHAVGPGHGKYAISGVGLGTRVPASRLVAMALASSLAQALWAILLVYGGFLLLEASAHQMTALAEEVLAPASHLAITGIGLFLLWRGGRALAGRNPFGRPMGHAHGGAGCGCHAHTPSADDIATLGSAREAAMLVASIAIRPCTGAIFLLVIAWQMDIRLAGAAAVVVMGLGTATLTGLVAVSSIAARGVTWAAADRVGATAVAVPALQALAGLVVVWISLIFLTTGSL